MEPRNLKKWLTVMAVVYLVFPRDLIPDFLGRGLGLLDDLQKLAHRKSLEIQQAYQQLRR